MARDLLGNEIFPEVVSGVGTIKEGGPLSRDKVAGPVLLSFLSLAFSQSTPMLGFPLSLSLLLYFPLFCLSPG